MTIRDRSQAQLRGSANSDGVEHFDGIVDEAKLIMLSVWMKIKIVKSEKSLGRVES
jgi:hypothetical protein